MKGSLKIGRFAGINVYIHWTFLLLIAYVLFYFGAGRTLGVALTWVLFVLTLFTCVLLHEFGHALTAKRYGILTHDITLLPIGGVARLERMPREPRQELLVAAAGPAVNVVIAGVLFAILMLIYGKVEFADSTDIRGYFWAQVIGANIVIVLFNLLPAFPMDGGRILRALLAIKLDYARATTIAARIGQVLAMLFALRGLFGEPPMPLLVLIGIFVFLGAEAESRMVQMTSVLGGLRVRDAMMTNFRTLHPDDTLATAARELLAGAQHDFPVTGNGVLGLLTRQDLVKGLTEHGSAARIGDVMRTDCSQITEADLVERTYDTLRQQNCSSLPVVRDGELVGLITIENITEWIMLNKAVRK